MKKAVKDNRYEWRKAGREKEYLYDAIDRAIDRAQADGCEDALVTMWTLQETREQIADPSDAENISACWELVDWIRTNC